MNQSRYPKETVSPKIGKNNEMLVCFICVGTQDRILFDVVIYYIIIYPSFSADKLKYIIHIIQKIKNNKIAKKKRLIYVNYPIT